MTNLHEPAEFRKALRAWLDENDLTAPEDDATESLAGHMHQFARVQKALYDADWGRYGWPEHAGGLGGPDILRAIVGELDSAPLPGRASDATEDSEALRKSLSALRSRAADLILAVQTLQLDPDYRRALDEGGWQAYFDEAHAGFEHECALLRQALARMR